jgi:hypothetical protein
VHDSKLCRLTDLRHGNLASTLAGATSSFESESEGALPVGRAQPTL